MSHKVEQQILLPRSEMLRIEQEIRIRRHVERYALLRQFAQGTVCDAACGCGYGSYLLATNPDVKKVIGLDISKESIEFANKEYKTDKTSFILTSVAEWTGTEKIDQLISVETIEHIQDKSILPAFVDRNKINQVLLTYPSKKTTHYNEFHHHDYNLQQVLDAFSSFTCYKHFNWEYEFDVVFLLRHK